MPELHPGQPELFLSPADANSYIEGTITGPSTTPRSYMLEAQGRIYHHNRQHIHAIHTDTTCFSRPSMHQGYPIPRPSEHQDTPISEPSTSKDSPITRPSSKIKLQIDDPLQQDPAKQSKQSHIPTLQCSATSSHNNAINCPTNDCLSPSHIPTPHCKPFSRPIDHSNKPFQDPSTTMLALSQNHQFPHLMRYMSS